VNVLHRLLNPLLTTQPDYRHHALLDTPRRRNSRHADIALLSDFLDTLDDLLVRLVLAFVHESADGVVGCGALGAAVGPGACEGAACDGGPGDEADTRVLAVGDLEVDGLVVRWMRLGLGSRRTISRSSSR